jgi:hypothetical protein
VDGFTLDQGFRNMPFEYPALALGQIELLRKARNLRPKWYQFPTLTGTNAFPSIGARGSYEKQIRVLSGSWLWAYTMFGAFSFQVTEQATNRKYAFDYELTQTAVGGQFGAVPGVKSRLCMIGEPWLILDPGLVNVELYDTTAALNMQELVLWFAEPVCAIEREFNPCSA